MVGSAPFWTHSAAKINCMQWVLTSGDNPNFNSFPRIGVLAGFDDRIRATVCVCIVAFADVMGGTLNCPAGLLTDLEPGKADQAGYVC